MAHEPATPGPEKPSGPFQPFVPADQSPAEFTALSVIFGALFGVVFGASTVYLALKAGLTVSASIPIAVISISVLRFFGRPTILQNNIVQTIGSAGESVAAGVAFTVPALLFLSQGPDGRSVGEKHFEYLTIMILAAVGGILGVLFMVPLRRSLIVAEHGTLPYPEGTACADVLVAGEKGGSMAGLVFGGVGVAFVYKLMNTVFAFWKETAAFVTRKTAVLPNATFAAEVSPEYLGVGYILGPRVGGIMVSGSILTFLVIIPLLSLIVPEPKVVADLLQIGYPQDKIDGWGQVKRFQEAYTRYIGAGAVTMAGIITLCRTMPTIVRSLRDSIAALGKGGAAGVSRTERDIPISVVAIGAVALAGVMAVLPIIPGDFTGKLLMAVLMLVFGFLFVTVSSRIVGIIGSSSNPISGMTIATLLGTALVFISLGLGGDANQPIALCVGAIVCIAAANAGATSQDLKTGYLVGATPIRQQIGLVIGVVVSTLIIGLTIKFLDTAYADKLVEGSHGIGTEKFPAPQANLMATVIKGVMSQNLPWGYILVGAGLAFMVWICGVSPLAWAVGAYLPIGTTMPIFLGGLLKALSDKLRGEKSGDETEISAGNLFATGLVAGGTLTGVASSILKAIDTKGADGKDSDLLTDIQKHGEHFQEGLSGFFNLDLLSFLCFAALGVLQLVIALRKLKSPVESKP